MITHKFDSDITKVKSGIIVHGCNAQSVMGSGVAKQLRATYPDIFTDYKNLIDDFYIDGCSPLGQVAWSDISVDLVIANAITQNFYGRDDKKYVSYDALDDAFQRVASFAKASDCTIHIPFLIGGGLGGGNANIIQRIIEENTQDLEVVYHHWK